jgi:endoglucanase
MSKGIALFVTEWGTCDSSGNGGLDYAESDIWLNFLKQNAISWLNFSLHDKAETASALKPGTLVTGPPSASDLTPSGMFVYNHLVAP